MKNQHERTLIVFKPDAVSRGIVGEVLARFEKVGLKIVGTKMLQPNTEFFHKHYEGIGTMITRHGQKIFDTTVAMMQGGPVIAVVLEGIDGVAVVRKMVGATESKSALPGTIRGDYSHMSYAHADEQEIGLPNILHASGDVAEAKLEIAHWFSENELFDYENVHEKFTQTRK
ncbi:MAG TPA: nucleoside-diphosphate kinase [Candidatus Paceibacterota bacterium]|jgi:nucleoside-diphosphate kinase|nr:nucleoside-diphosphate kinase [Candidatus Paceibacterota bacterium]